MSGYVREALVRFGRDLHTLNHQPHKHIKPVNDQIIQYTKPEDASPLLNDTVKKCVQKMTGMFLCYARVVDQTIFVALSAIVETKAPWNYRWEITPTIWSPHMY